MPMTNSIDSQILKKAILCYRWSGKNAVPNETLLINLNIKYSNHFETSKFGDPTMVGLV